MLSFEKYFAPSCAASVTILAVLRRLPPGNSTHRRLIKCRRIRRLGAGMSRVSKRMPWVEFAVALFVLIVVAGASDNVTARLDSDEHRVAHTREVETEIAQLRADLSAASAAPPIFLLADDKSVLEEFARAEAAIPA